MKRLIIAALLCALIPVGASASFDDYFTDKTMRIDYDHTGDAKTEIVSIDHVYEYGTWAGSLKNLVDRLNYGGYYHKVYDAESGELVYSRGFDSYFKEYQTSAPAQAGVVKAFHESAIVPCPKKKIVFALEKRQKEGNLVEIFRTELDPSDVSIIVGEGEDSSVKVRQSLDNGDPHVHADVAIIGEGYTADEEGKFWSDLDRFTKVFFKHEPMKSYKDRFNVYGVFKASQESGCDEPRHGVFRNTTLSASFNSLGSERYLLTEDNKALRDVASHIPYDALYIMVNHHRYGGGGIYNFYCVYTSDNQWSEYLMVHEFGHSFFGLADEYYTSDTAYDDFYPKGYEPAEPNITALLDPKNVKWKALLSKGIEVPTPWEKAGYDVRDLKWQRKRRELNDHIASLVKNHAPEAEVRAAEAEYDKLDLEHAQEMDKYLRASKYAGKVGVFEGAGYASKGLYRPMVDCIMFTKAHQEFCEVCKAAMVGVIEWYSQ
jgi:hypothetical protein